MFLVSTALALFIICPRMAGMVNVVCQNTGLPLIKTALFASLISIPLILAMVWVFNRFGIGGALAFCVFTDLISALLLSNVSWKASIESLIIAVFVLGAVKVAPLISGAIIKSWFY